VRPVDPAASVAATLPSDPTSSSVTALATGDRVAASRVVTLAEDLPPA
jgi:hypothetical protein